MVDFFFAGFFLHLICIVTYIDEQMSQLMSIGLLFLL